MMKRVLGVGAAVGLVLSAPATVAEAAQPRGGGMVVYISDQDSTADAVNDDIYAIDPRTRKVTRLTDDLPGVERWPVESPDGRSLAWVRLEVDAEGVLRPDLSAIYRCDLRRSHGTLTCRNARKVVGPVFENAVAWTADSRSLIYTGPLDAEGDADLYVVDLRSGMATNLTNEAAPDGTISQNSQPAVSPDGRFVVYAHGGPAGADLFRRDVDGSDPVQLTSAPLNDTAPEYSPDGRRLVFHANRDGDADVYTMRARPEGPGNPVTNLTDTLRAPDGTTPSQERAPSFSPDGRQISFWRFTQPAGGPRAGFDDGDIYAMRVDGSHVRNLTDNNPSDPGALTVGDIQPDWGPDSSRRWRR